MNTCSSNYRRWLRHCSCGVVLLLGFQFLLDEMLNAAKGNDQSFTKVSTYAQALYAPAAAKRTIANDPVQIISTFGERHRQDKYSFPTLAC